MKRKMSNRFWELSIVIQSVVSLSWIYYFIVFKTYYKDAIVFGKDEPSLLIKILVILNYRADGLLKLLIASVVLMSINVLFLLMLYLGYKKLVAEGKKDVSKLKRLLTIFLLLWITSTFLYLWNEFWIVMLCGLVFSLIVVYTAYNLVKFKYTDTLENETSIGPFLSEKAAIGHLKKYREKDIEKYSIYQEDNEGFYLDIFFRDEK